MEPNIIDSQISSLGEKAKAANLPPDLLEKTMTMLNLLYISLKSGASSSLINLQTITTYINWVSAYPFNKEVSGVMDIALARQSLDETHYGLVSVKQRIIEYLSSVILNTEKKESEFLHAPIICLVGLVGTGKTSLALSIAKALGRPFERIPFGGLSDVKSLRGSSKTFPEAEPGLIVKKLVNAKARNAVVLLDELDRVTEGSRADIMGVLVELLDPEQNHNFMDFYMDYPLDLSKIIFIATANNTTNISTAVLDRLEVIQMPSYSDNEKKVIGESYLLPKVTKQNGLNQGQIKIDEKIWPDIIRPLGFDSGIRSLERTLSEIARKCALQIVEGKVQRDATILINATNVKEFVNYG